MGSQRVGALKRSIMAQYIMKGGRPLNGEVNVSGAKNAALGILAAAVMTDENVLIENLPDVRDINVMLDAIREIGATIDRIDRNTVRINASTVSGVDVHSENMRRIRASYYLIGALLGKYKRANVPLPGGCAIGARPIDQHLKGFRALGAECAVAGDKLSASAERLTGSHIYLDIVSVGATINIMMAAALAEGRTILENAAKEPHIVDVANFLNSMGASIRGAGTDVIRITGVPKLHGTEYSIIPDQIEAGTFMFASAITRGDIMVRNLIPKHMEAISAKIDVYLPRRCVLDFGGVSFMDSSGIAIVIHSLRAMEELEGELWLANIPPQPMKVLRAAGIEKLVRFGAERSPA